MDEVLPFLRNIVVLYAGHFAEQRHKTRQQLQTLFHLRSAYGTQLYVLLYM